MTIQLLSLDLEISILSFSFLEEPPLTSFIHLSEQNPTIFLLEAHYQSNLFLLSITSEYVKKPLMEMKILKISMQLQCYREIQELFAMIEHHLLLLYKEL